MLIQNSSELKICDLNMRGRCQRVAEYLVMGLRPSVAILISGYSYSTAKKNQSFIIRRPQVRDALVGICKACPVEGHEGLDEVVATTPSIHEAIWVTRLKLALRLKRSRQPS